MESRPLSIALMALILSLATNGASGAGGEGDLEFSAIPHVSLCDALEAVQLGDRLRISVTASYHEGLLFDSFQQRCSRDVQPVTLVEWSPSLEAPAELTKGGKAKGPTIATFTGVLWAERRVGPDDLELPSAVAYANRVGGFRRFGPSMAYRTKLIVERIDDLRVLEAGAPRPGIPLATSRSPFPVVKSAAMIRAYPWKARQAHVSGDVLIQVALQKGNSVSTTVIAGDRLLAEDALENIGTWTFDPAAEGTFTTTFSYRFEDLPSTTASVRIQADLPYRVEIVAPLNGW